MASRKIIASTGRAAAQAQHTGKPTSTMFANREPRPGPAAPLAFPAPERCLSMCARSRLNREHAAAIAVLRRIST